jgi:glycosyltransferase involved in cell wall biosynthesis
MGKDLLKHFSLSSDKIAILPNPVDVKAIRRAAFGAGSPYQKDKKNVVAVGRLTYQKGFDLLIKSIQRVMESAPDIHLTIVGQGPQNPSLRSLAAKLGVAQSVTFAGQQDNPFPFMTHADLFVLSSRWEGSPNVALESLACGTPVLAFDCPGGIGEVVEHGKNGWLVSSEDWEAMATRMCSVLKNGSWPQMDAEDLLPERHTCHSVARKYEALITGEL